MKHHQGQVGCRRLVLLRILNRLLSMVMHESAVIQGQRRFTGDARKAGPATAVSLLSAFGTAPPACEQRRPHLLPMRARRPSAATALRNPTARPALLKDRSASPSHPALRLAPNMLSFKARHQFAIHLRRTPWPCDPFVNSLSPFCSPARSGRPPIPSPGPGN
jgi:hypothetical protein